MSVLRKALSGRSGLVRRALVAAASFDPGPFSLPGPTGESNRLSLVPKGVVLCLGAGEEAAIAQAAQALAAGCGVVICHPGSAAFSASLVEAGAPVVALDGSPEPGTLTALSGIAAVAAAGVSDWTRGLRLALAARPGAITPLETAVICPERYFTERHLCVDTTAAGGNASLLAAAE